jgi:hypothetical protein
LGKEKLRSYLKNGLPKIAHVIEYLRNQWTTGPCCRKIPGRNPCSLTK